MPRYQIRLPVTITFEMETSRDLEAQGTWLQKLNPLKLIRFGLASKTVEAEITGIFLEIKEEKNEVVN